ncbi:sulfotransferase family 2 domain-containing protein [Marinicella sp. W31]|uniref:sulfotransferase family 2 domain-containing protein n=1 Tax=Marinicella sp. W31 TaxID=3023713 RepID=UPI0037575F09
MIINHRYKFIFLKTRKTAGTSIEIALSKFCDAHDVITPITEEDEQLRKQEGFLGPQNYHIPFSHYHRQDWKNLIGSPGRKKFHNHAEALFIKENISAEIWNNYFKFTFERNPFDKAISRYYWSTRHRNTDISISKYLKNARVDLLSNWNTYTINDEIAVDFVGRYETLSDDLQKIKDKINLPENLNLPQAKGNYRKNRAHYTDVLDSQARSRIEIVCAKEIAAFDYRWSKS